MIALGSRIKDYLLLRVLGEGGMGVVYEALREDLGRRVAVKVLRPEFCENATAVRRLINEARAANRIQHPGLIEIYDCGLLDDGTAFLFMELLAGETLAARLKRQREDLPIGLLGLQIALAIQAAHDAGVVHRDLKPSNIMMIDDASCPGGLRVKVLDFGIAKLEPLINVGPHTRTGTVLGTPAYMAPEQCQGTGAIEASADVYALGVVFYEMLSGRPPFSAATPLELMLEQCKTPAPSLRELVPSLPVAITALVHQMLAKSPVDRPAIAEVVRRLQGFADLRAVVKTGAASVQLITTTASQGASVSGAPGERALQPPRSRRVGAVILASAVLLLGGFLARRAVPRFRGFRVESVAAAEQPARSCREVRQQIPNAPDGEYPITVGDGEGARMSVYCHDMAHTPREYLTLPRSYLSGDGEANCSFYGPTPNVSPEGLLTCFSRVRFIPDKLLIDGNDQTFVRKGGGRIGAGWNFADASPYGLASDCVKNESHTGRANINLRGTPLAVEDDQFVLSGWRPGGTATLHAFNQVADLEGGGFCGDMGTSVRPSEGEIKFVTDPIKLRWGCRIFLGVRGGFGLRMSGAFGPDRFKTWTLMSLASSDQISAATVYDGEFYVASDDTFYRHGGFSVRVEDNWKMLGHIGKIDDLATHNGSLYGVSKGRLWTLDLPSLAQHDVGAAADVRAMASYEGTLYFVAHDQLQACVHGDAANPQRCTEFQDRGPAIGVTALGTHEGQLYAAAGSKLLRNRRGVLPAQPNNWEAVGDLTGLDVVAIVSPCIDPR